jgi:hypothetical protein
VNRLAELRLSPLEGVRIEVIHAQEVRFSGLITVPNSHDALLPSIRALHEAALGDAITELTVDVRLLTFVNSSAIRLFIDWSTWLRNLDESKRYKLLFVTDKSITWQRTSFLALKSLVPAVIEVQP